MIAFARLSLIAAAILLSPIYAAWVLGGRLADRRAQAKAVKGNRDR